MAWVAVLVAAGVACSSSNASLSEASGTCGNGIVEPGEQCDGPLVPTCGQVTNNVLTDGFVACVMCRLNTTACRAGPGAPVGAGGVNGAGLANGGGLTGNGGIVGNGGIIGNAGIVGNGGVLGSGGFPPPGGLPGAGGMDASGGFSASGGFAATGGVGAGGIAGTGGAGTGGDTSTGPLGDVNALRQACVDTINQYRATLSLPPLTRASASVETCSDTGAESDATAMVAHGSAGKCPNMSAQDTCPGWRPGQYGGVENAMKACLQGMWSEGEPPEGRDQCIQEYFSGNTACFLAHGHYLNMSSTDNTIVSCGFYVMPDGRVWMNQDFGG